MINVKELGSNLPKDDTKYYLATYRKYTDNIPDFISNKEVIVIDKPEELAETLKNYIGQLALFNQENKETILKGELGNYILQQKIINE